VIEDVKAHFSRFHRGRIHLVTLIRSVHNHPKLGIVEPDRIRVLVAIPVGVFDRRGSTFVGRCHNLAAGNIRAYHVACNISLYISDGEDKNERYNAQLSRFTIIVQPTVTRQFPAGKRRLKAIWACVTERVMMSNDVNI